MPFVAYYIAGVLVFAVIAWAIGDHRRAGGLAVIAAILPVAFFSYNYLTPPAGNHAMTLLWLVVPLALYKQGLIDWLPAILGEFIAIPYLLASLYVLDAAAALWWGDFFGLTMLALIVGPIVGELVGMGVSCASLRLGGSDLAIGSPRDQANEAQAER